MVVNVNVTVAEPVLPHSPDKPELLLVTIAGFPHWSLPEKLLSQSLKASTGFSLHSTVISVGSSVQVGFAGLLNDSLLIFPV